MTYLKDDIEKVISIKTTKYKKNKGKQEKFDLLCDNIFYSWILNNEYYDDDSKFEQDLINYYFQNLPDELQGYASDIIISAFRTYKRGKKTAAKIILVMLNSWIKEYK